MATAAKDRTRMTLYDIPRMIVPASLAAGLVLVVILLVTRGGDQDSPVEAYLQDILLALVVGLTALTYAAWRALHLLREIRDREAR